MQTCLQFDFFGVLKMLKFKRSFQFTILLAIFTSIVVEDCSCNLIACNNETFLGRDATTLSSTDYAPCNTSDTLCYLIPSQFQPLCSSASANYSFNFSSDWNSCKKFNQVELVPCHLVSKGLVCNHDTLSQCSSEKLANCLLTINVFASVSSKISKQFRFQMHQIPKYVKSSSLRVKKLLVKVNSAREVQISWSRPDCQLLEYRYKWMFMIPGGNESRSGEETLSDSKGDDNHAAIIKGLNPYTNYTICIMSRVDGSYSHMKGPCRTVQTLQAKPERAPEILTDTATFIAKKLWQCDIRWKNVDKKYWNGIVTKMRIDVFKKEKPKEHFPIFVPVEKSSHIISPLDVKSEYYVILRLCNEVACSSSQRRFISIVKKGKDDFPIEYVVLVGVGTFLFICIVVLFVSIKKRRARRTTSTDQLVPDEGPPPSDIPDPDIIVPIPRNDGQNIDAIYENVYDSINPVSDYDRVDNPSMASASNLCRDNIREDGKYGPVRWEGASSDSCEGASNERAAACEGGHSHCSKNSFVTVAMVNRNEEVCNRNEGACSCLVDRCSCSGGACGCDGRYKNERGGACSRDEGDNHLRKNSLFIIENQGLCDWIDQIESSEDDESQTESYELSSQRDLRSLSFETDPLMPQDP